MPRDPASVIVALAVAGLALAALSSKTTSKPPELPATARPATGDELSTLRSSKELPQDLTHLWVVDESFYRSGGWPGMIRASTLEGHYYTGATTLSGVLAIDAIFDAAGELF